MDRNTDFGSLVLTTYSILEATLLGQALTNRSIEEQVRELQKKHYKALVDYLNTGNQKAKDFLKLCNSHISDIFNGNLDFLS